MKLPTKFQFEIKWHYNGREYSNLSCLQDLIDADRSVEPVFDTTYEGVAVYIKTDAGINEYIGKIKPTYPTVGQAWVSSGGESTNHGEREAALQALFGLAPLGYGSNSSAYRDELVEDISHGLAEKAAPEQDEIYTCLCLSTGHLSPNDLDLMPKLASGPREWMVMIRPPGVFIKLYDEPELNTREVFSITLNAILSYARRQGHRLVEFDRDGPVNSLFPIYAEGED